MPKKVSIVIPCRNEEKYIGKCIDSVINSTYDKNFLEVFICDGMSNDKTREVLAPYMQESFIKLLDNTAQTTPHALNLGIKNSTGDIIIILGSHAEIFLDYIEKCVSILESDPKIGCAGGVLENVIEDRTSAVIAKAMSSPFGVGNVHFRTGGKDGFVDTVAFGAYKREVFAKAGLFDEELIRNQDDEYNYRLTKNGYTIFFSHAIRAKYYVRASFGKLAKQYYQYGYWKVFVNKKHKAVTTLRQIAPPVFVLFITLGLIASFFFKLFLFTYLSCIGLYFLMGVYASLKAGSTFFETPQVIYSFLLLHFNYGVGYLQGIWDFVLLNKRPSTSASQITR